MSKTIIKIKLNENGIMPTKAHDTDAGWDLYSAKNINTIEIKPHQIASVPTGVFIQVPPGYYVQLAERSGVSINTPLKLKAGIIDSGYTGEVKMIFENDSHESIFLSPEMKLAQMIIHKIPDVEFIQVDELDDTERGKKGFGSSGY